MSGSGTAYTYMSQADLSSCGFRIIQAQSPVYIMYISSFYLQQKKLRIHEDPNGSIYIAGVTSHRVESEEEVRGGDSLCRVMGGWTTAGSGI